MEAIFVITVLYVAIHFIPHENNKLLKFSSLTLTTILNKVPLAKKVQAPRIKT